MMNNTKIVTVERFLGTPTESLGTIRFGDRTGYTLEDTNRAKKQYGVTCINGGEYNVKTTYSGKFKRSLPLVYNSDDRKVVTDDNDSWSGIRFHGGIHARHTHGCILVGDLAYSGVRTSPYRDEYGNVLMNYISNSKDILEDLIDYIGDDEIKLVITYKNEMSSSDFLMVRSRWVYSKPCSVIQMKLCDLNYDLKVDGLFGTKTLDAVKVALNNPYLTRIDRDILTDIIKL